MLGRKDRGQLELLNIGSLRGLIPDDHVLARIDDVPDVAWCRAEVWGLYCPDKGRPGIDPEVAVRPMPAGFLPGIVQGRRLVRDAQVTPAIRWFTVCALHEALPDHSSLTRIRQRWGEGEFRRACTRLDPTPWTSVRPPTPSLKTQSCRIHAPCLAGRRAMPGVLAIDGGVRLSAGLERKCGRRRRGTRPRRQSEAPDPIPALRQGRR